MQDTIVKVQHCLVDTKKDVRFEEWSAAEVRTHTHTQTHTHTHKHTHKCTHTPLFVSDRSSQQTLVPNIQASYLPS